MLVEAANHLLCQPGINGFGDDAASTVTDAERRVGNPAAR